MGASKAVIDSSTLRRSRAILAAFIAIGTLTACGASESTATQPDQNELVIGMSQEPSTLWPGLGSMMAQMEVLTLIGLNKTTSMTYVDDKWEMQAHLTGYRDSPDSPLRIPRTANGGMVNLCELHPSQSKGERCGKWVEDMKGKRVKALMVSNWEIRADAKWSDGTPVTVDDVVFGYHFMMSPDLPVVDRTIQEKIAWIGPAKEESGEDSRHKFKIYWKELYAYSEAGTLEILPRHILHAPFVMNPGRIKEHWYGKKPVGWGPFMIHEYRRGSHIILKPNPHYWGKDDLKIDKITYRFIPNTNSLKAALEAGDIDATSEVGLNVDDVVKLQKRYPKRWNFHFRPGLVWEHIDLRQDTSAELHGAEGNPLEDVRVRQALVHSANRQLIADALFEGKVKVADSYLPDMHYAYHKSIKTYPFDMEKAAALLDEAGWVPGSDGIRVKDGRRLHLEFGTTAENKLRELVQQVLQQDWKRVGIEVEVRNEPPSVFFGQTTRHRRFKHMAMYAWLLSPVAAGDNLYRGDKVPSKENNWQGQNYSGIDNGDITKSAIAGEKTLDQGQRTELVREVQDIYASELPSIPLFFRVNCSITSSRLKHWRPTGTLVPTTWNAHQWEMTGGER